jgi:hypothetical protein
MSNTATATKPTVTVHGVLAGAYAARGRGQTHIGSGPLLTHASADGGDTAMCGRVSEGSLCDEVLDTAPTCPVCARRLAPKAKGRPRLSAAAAERVVGVRFSPEDYDRLKAAAEAANTSMSELLRMAWERGGGR